MLDDKTVIVALRELVEPPAQRRVFRVVPFRPLLQRVALEHAITETAAWPQLIALVVEHGGGVHRGYAGFPDDAWAALTGEPPDDASL